MRNYVRCVRGFIEWPNPCRKDDPVLKSSDWVCYNFCQMPEDVAAYLSSKVGEYRILSAPLERAAREMEYAHQLLRSKVESEIAEEVPVLGALANILDISILDIILAPDRYRFIAEALENANMSTQDVVQQLRALGPPPKTEDLAVLGLPA